MKLFLDPARFLQAAALLTSPLAVVAPRALAIVLPVAALGAGIAALRVGALDLPPVATTILVAVLAWGGASAVWAFEPRLVWSVWFQIAGLAAAGLVLLGIARHLDDGGRASVGTALAIGVIVALAFLFIEWASARLFDHSLMAMVTTRRPFTTAVFNRGAATVALLVWPAALVVWQRRGAVWGVALILAAMAVVLQFDSLAAIIGLLAGGLVGMAAAWRARPVAWTLAALVILGTATAPVLPRLPAADALIERTNAMVRPGNGLVSIVHRLQIWQFAAEAVAERPLTGWGLNASRDLPGGIAELSPGVRRLPLHPHNAVLQWWLELGAVGAAFGAALVVLAVLRASQLWHGSPAGADAAKGTALAMTASAVVVASVGYGIWQAWWMAALWLAAVFMATLAGATRTGKAAR
jgi:exopolysaccharide production protein ExoQ